MTHQSPWEQPLRTLFPFEGNAALRTEIRQLLRRHSDLRSAGSLARYRNAHPKKM